MTSALTVRGLSRSYSTSSNPWEKGQKLKALVDINFDLEKGKTLASVGESGCGKTTLAKQITFIEEPNAGEIFLDGNLVRYRDKREVRKIRQKIQMVFQNPYSSLNPRQKIFNQIEEPLCINTKENKATRIEHVHAMMSKVGLRIEHGFRYPHMFSGGQCQRIAIARAMILNPKILIADEPTSALDISIQAQILNLFMDLQEEFDTAYLLISHNLSVVEHIANDMIVMYLGKIVEQSDKLSLFKQPLHPYTQALLSATPFLDPKKRQVKIKISGELPSLLNPPKGCAFHERCPYTKKRCSQEEPILRQVDNHLVACHFAEKINA
jgi:dipeptide transport system ATP-binding protein